MNSLQNEVSNNDWANAMVLFFKNKKYSDKILIVLEGHTDIGLFRKACPNDAIHYDSPCDGKEGVIRAVKEIRENGFGNVYGVCDADFDHINGKSYENIYMTDYHDVEMMMLNSNFLDVFFHEYTDHRQYNEVEKKSKIESIKNNIFDACYSIGILKWANYENELGLVFKGMSYHEFVSANSFELHFDERKYIEHIYQRSNKKISMSDIYTKYNEYKNKTADMFHICNGHDFTYLLSYMYRQDITTDKNMNQDKVERGLRLCYSKEYFLPTKLGQCISQLVKAHAADLQHAS